MNPVFVTPEGEIVRFSKQPTLSPDVEELSDMERITQLAQREAEQQSTNKTR